jgi:two-component system CheB/CheR fusion protein
VGLREQETLGEHFLNLDTGLPTDKLKTLIRDVTSDGVPGREIFLDAVNRRGRAIQLRVSVTPLLSGDEAPGGALMLMELVAEPE